MDVEQLEVAEQRLAQDRAERAHDDDVRLGGGDALPCLRRVDVVGLVEVDAEALGEIGDGRRGEPAPAAGRTVRAGDDEDRSVRGLRQALEDAGGEPGRAEVDGAHGAEARAGYAAASACSRRMRMASLR